MHEWQLGAGVDGCVHVAHHDSTRIVPWLGSLRGLESLFSINVLSDQKLTFAVSSRIGVVGQ